MVVFNGDVPVLSGFSSEREHHIVSSFCIIALDVLDVHRFERGQAVGFVGASVFVRTNADVVQVHEADDKGRYGVETHIASVDVPCYLTAKPWQLRGKIDHIVVLHFRGDLRPVGMVAILQPTFHVSSRSLNMTSWVRTNPHVFPSRW